jgi:hypothetical protein
MSFGHLQGKNEKQLYKCPTCGAVAHIDKEHKQITMRLSMPNLPKPKPVMAPISIAFPNHPDCELAKSINDIDLNKLVKVEKK